MLYNVIAAKMGSNDERLFAQIEIALTEMYHAGTSAQQLIQMVSETSIQVKEKPQSFYA